MTFLIDGIKEHVHRRVNVGFRYDFTDRSRRNGKESHDCFCSCVSEDVKRRDECRIGCCCGDSFPASVGFVV
jgi:hypothetical protein